MLTSAWCRAGPALRGHGRPQLGAAGRSRSTHTCTGASGAVLEVIQCWPSHLGAVQRPTPWAPLWRFWAKPLQAIVSKGVTSK